MSNNIPPKTIKRNEFGLIEGIDYIFDENGLVNWRAMIEPKYLVPNKLKTQETDITKIADADLLITLAGLKNLANLRGFDSVYYDVHSSSIEYCCVHCTIQWMKTYETENHEVTFAAIADANINNTESFAKQYLSSIAENRAFSRCVRSFLRIHIVSDEEINKDGNSKTPAENSNDAQVELLQKAIIKKGLTFEILKEKMIQEGFKGAAELTKLSDLPPENIFQWLTRVKKYKPGKEDEVKDEPKT